MLLEKGAEQAVEDGDIAIKEYPKVKAALDLYRLVTTKHPDLEKLDNHWIHGEPGVGKSKMARERWPNHYNKSPDDNWFTGYNGEDTILIDDFEPVNRKQTGLLKRLADHYSTVVRVHGLQISIRPKQIVITSNFRPNEIWEGSYLAAIERRFTIWYLESDRITR